MATYGQFCPVAKAMEVLDERWTLLVVRELLEGSIHFNELRRGVPRMSPALLSKRLRTLERAGVVRRESTASRTSYQLTAAGRELATVVDALGTWGVRWIGELGDQDLDPHLLLWDMRRKTSLDEWPRTRTVLALTFEDVIPAQASWWIVVANGTVDVCDSDPGYEPTATISTSLRTLTRIWRGDQSWDTALRKEDVRISAATEVRRRVPTWLGQSRLANVPRPV